MDRKDILKKYGGLFLLAVGIIIFYKLFDSLSIFVDIIQRLMSILTPVAIGGVLAYFLQPLVSLLEKKFIKSEGFFKNNKRLLSVLIVFLSFILLLVIIVVVLAPIIADTIVDLASSMDTYVNSFEATARSMIENEDILHFVLSMENGVVSFFDTLATHDPMTYFQSAFSAASTMITWLIGLVFCPYILIERDSLLRLFDRILLLVISQEKVTLIHDYAYRSHKIFGDFIYGKFIDSVIIGLIALVGFGILGLKFFPLLALIVLITNMIPYFGPFIGGIPVVFFVLLTGGLMPAVWTALFILALQQFDGLILGPAILGGTVGISPFWIIFAITVFGGLFGFVGMFLGVPLICVIRMFFNDYLEYRKKGKVPINSSK